MVVISSERGHQDHSVEMRTISVVHGRAELLLPKVELCFSLKKGNSLFKNSFIQLWEAITRLSHGLQKWFAPLQNGLDVLFQMESQPGPSDLFLG